MAKENKLQNIKAIKEMIAGTHKFQTNKIFGAGGGKRYEKHEVGDKWEETEADGTTWIVEQHKGFRTKKSKHAEIFSEVRDYLQSFPKCPKETCTCDPNYHLNKKMRTIHGMGLDCVVDMEHKLKVEGKFDEYARTRIENNARDWLKRAEQDVEMLRKAYTEASKVVINGEGEIDTYSARMTPEEFAEKVEKGFELYKKDFLEKLEKNVTKKNNEND
jgi:hypothetical protein